MGFLNLVSLSAPIRHPLIQDPTLMEFHILLPTLPSTDMAEFWQSPKLDSEFSYHQEIQQSFYSVCVHRWELWAHTRFRDQETSLSGMEWHQGLVSTDWVQQLFIQLRDFLCRIYDYLFQISDRSSFHNRWIFAMIYFWVIQIKNSI